MRATWRWLSVVARRRAVVSRASLIFARRWARSSSIAWRTTRCWWSTKYVASRSSVSVYWNARAYCAGAPSSKEPPRDPKVCRCRLAGLTREIRRGNRRGPSHERWSWQEGRPGVRSGRRPHDPSSRHRFPPSPSCSGGSGSGEPADPRHEAADREILGFVHAARTQGALIAGSTARRVLEGPRRRPYRPQRGTDPACSGRPWLRPGITCPPLAPRRRQRAAATSRCLPGTSVRARPPAPAPGTQRARHGPPAPSRA